MGGCIWKGSVIIIAPAELGFDCKLYPLLLIARTVATTRDPPKRDIGAALNTNMGTMHDFKAIIVVFVPSQ